MTVSEKSMNKVCKAITGGATMKEILKDTELGERTVGSALSILRDQGRVIDQIVDREKNIKEYYFIDDPENLPEVRKELDRKEKSTGIRLSADESTIHTLLKKKNMTVGEISRSLHKPRGVSKEYVHTILESLQKKGFAVKIDEARKEAILDTSEIIDDHIKPLELEPLYKHRIKFGMVSDMQLGSKYQQLTLLHTAYEIMKTEEVDFTINLGDVVEGINMYRGQHQEIFLHGADEQGEYTVKNYPKSETFKTYIIAGNHDLSFKKIAGYNVVEAICKERPDLVYKGDIGAHSFKIKNLTFDIVHPSGGVPYAKSYRIQKIIEGALGDIISRMRSTHDVTTIPHFLAMGHLHIMCYTPHIGIKGFMVPCFQSQTPYLKAKGLMPEVGFIILDVECDDEWNINKITIDHHDLGAYVKEGDY